jgi:hypothetical protein
MFPMRMTSVEKYHLWDDSPSFPNNFVAQVTFRGRLDRNDIETAIRETVKRHPLYQGRAALLGRRWIWAEDHSDRIDLRFVDGETDDLPPVDPRSDKSVRLVVSIGHDESRVTALTHHAICDGIGGLQILQDALIAYDRIRSGRPPFEGAPPLDPELLRRRGTIGLLSGRYLMQLWKQPIAIFGAAKFLLRQFRTFAAGDSRRSPVGVTPYRFPSMLHVRVQSDALHRLRASLTAKQISLNDFLLTTLFKSVSESPELDPHGDRCMRIIVPISIRDKSDRGMPSANRTTLVQIDRFASQIGDLDAAARGISFELGVIRGAMLDRIFLIVVRILSISNGWLRWSASSMRPRATTLFTNLGRFFAKMPLGRQDRRLVCGGLVIERLELAAPVRNQMPISFTANQYAGELFLGATVDTRFLDEASGRWILDRWLEHLDDASGPVPGSRYKPSSPPRVHESA